MITRANRTRRSISVAYYLLEDKRLSLKAKGLMATLISLAGDSSERANINDLMAHCCQGSFAIKKAMDELIAHGYVERTRYRDETGVYGENIYKLYDVPIGEGDEHERHFLTCK